MKSLLFATASALSLAATPTVAQQADLPLGSTNSVSDKRDYTPEQQAVYDALETEQRATVDTWPYERQAIYLDSSEQTRVFYWALEPDQEPVWWSLTPAQRRALVDQDETERHRVLSGQVIADYAVQAPEAANQAAAPQLTYVSRPVVQDHAQHSGDYPVCESDADDTCVNAWEAGQRGPGVSEPLDYWPGEPASS